MGLESMLKTSALAILLFVLTAYSAMAQTAVTQEATEKIGKAAVSTSAIDIPGNSTSTPVLNIALQETNQTVIQKSSDAPATEVIAFPEGSSDDDWKSDIFSAYNRMHELLGDRLHIGLRTMTFDLDDESRVGQGYNNYYLGWIDQLRDQQDSSWGNLTLGIYPVRNFGIEYRYDKVVARTFNTTGNPHSDGNFEVDGPIFLAVARLPLDQVVTLFNKVSGKSTGNQNTTVYKIARRFIPYVGIGYADLSGSFDADTWWENGYESPESWRSLGSPEGTIYNGCTREIRVTGEDVDHYFVFGLSILIIDGFYADISYSKVDVDLTADYTYNRAYRYTRTIPMSYSSTSIGLRYYF